jgi:hypothetical protein
MPKPGFNRNSKAVARILHNVDGGKRAVAEKIKSRILAENPELTDRDVFLVTYHTDREVVGVVVRADLQAKKGIATRAAQQVASE